MAKDSAFRFRASKTEDRALHEFQNGKSQPNATIQGWGQVKSLKALEALSLSYNLPEYADTEPI